MTMRNATIYDVAHKAGVSPSTVSRALGNSSHPVSEEIRSRIQEAAKQLNYIPNAQARSLKTQNSASVGVIIPSIDNPFYPQVVRGMSDEAIERNYSIYLSNCDREYKLTDLQIQKMLEQNINGIISVYIEKTTPGLRRFVERGGTLVALCGKNYAYKKAYNFQTDKVNESEIAVEHLIRLGHKKIALFMNEINCQIRKDKYSGYRNALEREGIPFDSSYYYMYGKDVTAGRNDSGLSDADRGMLFARALLERSPDVTAVLCMNDTIALGVCAEFRRLGIRVPEDYSVMGFDDMFFSAYCSPSITTVALERYQWGRTLMKFLLDRLDRGTSEPHSYEVPDGLLVPVHLVKRESTGVPRSSNIVFQPDKVK